MRTGEQWTIQPLVTRVKSHINYSECITKQKRVVGDGHGISLYKKFVFMRAAQMEERSGVYNVICKAGFSMTTQTQSLVLLGRDASSIECFLLSAPNTNNIPETKFKTISVSEASAFRSRIRSTERRIQSQQKCQILLKEVDIMEHVRRGSSEWDFEELIKIRGCADGVEECDDSSDSGEVDHLSFDIGEMVAVRSSSGSASANPFWLASVMEVKEPNLSGKTLVVHWYQLKSSRTSHRDRGDVCYEGRYEPCDRNLSSSFDEIPAQSVYCCFESLTLNGSMPFRAQHQTRQAIADAGDVLYDFACDISAGRHERSSVGSCVENQTSTEPVEEISTQNIPVGALNEGSMVTVRCPVEEEVPFWLGKVVSFQSANHLRFKVQWFKTMEPTDSGEKFCLSTFVVDQQSPKTTTTIDSIFATFKSLKKDGSIPKKVLRETKKMI